MPTALIRPVPNTFDRALVQGGRPALDTRLARDQHDGYRRQLEEAGYTISVVPSDDAHPDSVFVEDTAVIVGSVAVIARPGAPTRRGETGPVASVLESLFPLERIVAPATMDGGDVFTSAGRVFVGRSARTNDLGIEQLRSISSSQGMELVPVEVHKALHLKSAVLPIDEETVVVTRGAVDEQRLTRLRIIYEDEAERGRFSALPLRDGRVLVTANAPITADKVAADGHHPVPIDVSQIQAADGGLTCMSILLGQEPW
jgi:dimethylargininase